MKGYRPIGVFDSGVGGLTVVRELERILPKESIIYFGDTARVPYGTKSKETVTKFSVENIEFLMRHDVKLVVVACNTASSLSLPFLKRCFRVPITGVIEPGARAAVSVTRNKKIGVIGTSATIASGAYLKEIRKIDNCVKVFSQSCPLFVPLVEEGWIREKATSDVAARYLKPLGNKDIDTLIMGCTHYPLLEGVIKNAIGRDVVLIDSAKQVAWKVKEILDIEGLLNDCALNRKIEFYVSDEPRRFSKVGRMFLKKQLKFVKRVK